jgi:hypothetical protein
MSGSLRVRAYKVTDAFLCSFCSKWVSTGRGYEALAAIDGRASFLTICQSCRKDFAHADLELDAPDMYEDWRARHPNEEEDAQDRLRDTNDWPPSPEEVR